ncbi:protein of unknown function [Methylacidimicrobium sp. AP8]|nr:protein of unknown function [Methylacidimicrobium sp. AP8]
MGSAAYALTPAVALFRTSAMMVFKRLPVIGAVAGFAEAGYDAYQALRCAPREGRGSGRPAAAGSLAGSGSRGQLGPIGGRTMGMAGAFAVSALTEREAAGIERMSAMAKDGVEESGRIRGIEACGEEGRSRKGGEEVSPAKEREIGKSPDSGHSVESLNNGKPEEPSARGFFGEAPGRWAPRPSRALAEEEEAIADSASVPGARVAPKLPQSSEPGRVGPAFGMAAPDRGNQRAKGKAAQEPTPVSPEEARERAIQQMVASFRLHPWVKDTPELQKMREDLCRFVYPIMEEKRRKGELPPEREEKPKSSPSPSPSVNPVYSFCRERPPTSRGQER